MKHSRVLAGLGAAALSLALVLPQADAAGNTAFTITGSTQMYTLGALMAQQYDILNTTVNITVTPASGQQGFDQTCSHSVPVGMTDMYIQDNQLLEGGCDDMVSVPVAVSAVAVVYNLPGALLQARQADKFTLVHPVRLTADIIAGIYLGTIKKWNDPAIAALNGGLSLPSQPIRALSSAEPGGSGFVFNQWLALSNPTWMKKVGVSILPAWPPSFSTGTTGSGDMVNKIQSTPYSFGFVGFDYAIADKLQAAAIRNASGVFQTPSLNGVSKAIAYQLQGLGIPSDFRRPFVTVPGKDAYNPADFEFWLVHRNLKGALPNDPDQRKAIRDFLNWTIQEKGGQQFIEQIALRKIVGATTAELAHGFVPVPPAIRKASQRVVDSLIY